MLYSELKHHGVPGMKWGVRKASESTTKSKITKSNSSKKSSTVTIKKKHLAIAAFIAAFVYNNRENAYKQIIRNQQRQIASGKKRSQSYLRSSNMNKMTYGELIRAQTARMNEQTKRNRENFRSAQMYR